MRLQLIWCVRMLADTKYQQIVWLKRQPPGKTYYDSMDDVIHCLFDDTPIAKSANDAIGVILKNEDEAEAIGLVIKAIEKIMDLLPVNSSSEAYINSEYWPEVVATSTLAYKLLSQGMDPSGMFEDVNHGWSPPVE